MLQLNIAQAGAPADGDDSDTTNKAARRSATHAVSKEDERSLPPHDSTLFTSPIALDPEDQLMHAAVATPALSQPVISSSTSDATIHTTHHQELSSSGVADEHLDELTARSAPGFTSAMIDDSHSLLSRSTMAHALEREPAHGGARTSTIDSQTTSPDDITTPFPSGHMLEASPPEIGSEPPTPSLTNDRSAQRGSEDLGTHHPPTMTVIPSRFVGSVTVDPATLTPEVAQAMTDASTSPHPRTAEERDVLVSPSAHPPMTSGERGPQAGRVVLEIDGTERDLEAGPPILSPTSDDPPVSVV